MASEYLISTLTTILSVHLKRHAAFICLAFWSCTRNGCPNQAKCSCFLGPGGRATSHLWPFSIRSRNVDVAASYFAQALFFFQNNRTSRVELLMFHQKFLKKYLFSNFKILGNCYRSDSERATLFFVENFQQSTPDVKYKGFCLGSVLPPGM